MADKNPLDVPCEEFYCWKDQILVHMLLTLFIKFKGSNKTILCLIDS